MSVFVIVTSPAATAFEISAREVRARGLPPAFQETRVAWHKGEKSVSALAGAAGIGADASTLPCVKLVKTKMSSTAPVPWRVAKAVGTKFELNPCATVRAREVKLEPGVTPTSGVI